jgi:putative addiction module component (TIGR02574 family)
MARSLQQIQEDIWELSTSNKEALLRALWEDLDGPADPGVDAAWLDEAKRRDAEMDAGSVESVPASEVFERLRASIKK